MALLCFVVSAQSATLFSTNANWRLFRGTNEASSPDLTAWRSPGFADSSFADAPAPFWYGDVRPGGTQLNDMLNSYTCIFLRKNFTMSNVGQVGGLRLTFYADDGFVLWINGTEVYRERVADLVPTIATVAANQPVDPAIFTSVVVTPGPGVLQDGVNLIAVQMFNTAAGSSDLGFDLVLESIVTETTPPVIAAVSPLPGNLTSLSSIAVTFSEPVSGVDADDFLINTQPAASVSGSGSNYTFTFTQPLYGNVSISWFPTHGIADEALPPNPFDGTAPSAVWQYTLVDVVPPTVTGLFPAFGVTLRSLSQVEVTFSEEVNGVNAADLLINNQPASSVARAPGGPYIFSFPSQPEGPVNLAWAAGHGIVDQASAPNAFAGGAWNYVVDPNAPLGDLVINEILASNQNGLTDENTNQQDWIEIYNRGATPVDLAGWSLANDPDAPSQWIFPAKILGAGQYLVVFASGLDRRDGTGTNRLHTNFQLSSGGEFLGLYNADSPRGLVSSLNYPGQRNDISFGYDTQNQLRYFATPSPGGPNGNSSITGLAAPVHFSAPRGFYSRAFDLVLTCPTPAATIRYTTDGSEPTALNGSLYTALLRITNTAMIRAAAFRTNLLSSTITTHSYLFNFTAAQRTIPFINVVTATNNLIGRTGIIGMGGGTRASDGLFITNNPATDFHNPSMHGIAWEKPVSVEYILPEDNSGFQIDAGLRVQGSDWQRPRTLPTSKFSFRLYFRGDYGQSKLDYPFFPLTTVDSFSQLVLRAGFNENVNPFIRDEMTRRLSHDMGQVAAHGSMALLLLNGGPYTNAGPVPIYNTTERVTKEFLQSQLGGGPDWDVVAPDFATSASGLGVIDGDRNDFRNLMTNFWSGTAIRPITNSEAYLRVASRLDIANFVDYAMLNAYVAMGDWPANNWRAGRERVPGALWRYIAWDCEWAMGIYALSVGRDSFAFSGTGTEDAGLASVGNSEIARTYQALRPNPEFRLLWADRIHKHFNRGGALTSLNISNRFEELRVMLLGYIPTMETEIPAWGRDRLPIIMGQFNTYGLYGFSNALYGVFASSNAPAFNQHGGSVAPGFALTMTAPFAGSEIYYTINGDDPRVMFTGAVSNSAALYAGPIGVGQSMRVRARSLWQGTNWSAINEADFSVASLGIPLRLTELNYNPVNPAHEFLEIQNTGTTPVDLGGMTFDGINYTFNVGASLAGGQRLLLVSNFDPAGFAARYPGVAVFGFYGGNLSNGGERLALKDRNGNLIFSVDYSDGGGWPAAADGRGASLEVTDVFGDPDDAANWHASASPGGSPGDVNSSATAPAVLINEVLAENGGVWNHGGTFPDFIELHNPGVSEVDLAGWSLTDDGDARKFVFPALGSTIPVGGYLTVWCDDATNTTPGLHAGFALNRSGDSIFLFDPATNRVDAFTYGLQLTNHSVGLVSGDWLLTTPSPGGANVAAPVAAPSSLRINEWLANSPPGLVDWIELHNTSNLPVALRGAFLGTSNTFHRITSLSFIAPLGFVQLIADEGVGADHLDFKLPAAGGAIVLYDDVAQEINRVTYVNALEGLTRGRLPDGDANIVNFPGSASPGASNYLNTYIGPVLNEILARNQTAVTNAGGQPDYVELFNASGSPFNFTGMSLSVNSVSPGQWMFPAGATLAANSYLVVWCDASRPASTNVGSYNTGRSLDGDSGGVYLFNAAGQIVNSIDYGPQVVDRSIGLSAAQWRLLATPTPGTVNAAAAALGTNAALRLNEWMANPASGNDWFEIYNTTNLPVALGELYLTDDPSSFGQTQFRIPALSFVGPRGFVQYVADNDPEAGRNHVNFSLDAAGELIRIYSTNGAAVTLLDSVVFGVQALAVSSGRLPDGQASLVSFPGSATPSESNYQLASGLVINEVLTHTDPPLEDAVEIFNETSGPIVIGGWFLSDSQDDFKKFRIPDGTSVPAGGFVVIYQNQFSNGTPASFTFNSAHGDEAWLSQADAGGNLTGLRTGAKFGAAAHGVSFGRYVTPVGVDYVAMSARTFGVDNPSSLADFRTGAGLANAAPQVGPVIISEIMYNPVSGAEEYIELLNTNPPGFPVNLFRSDTFLITNTWRISGGIEFSFPVSVQIGGGERVVIVDFDPANATALASFRARYQAPSVRVFGPFIGNLSNSGDDVSLFMPDATQPSGAPDAGFVPCVLVDRVDYTDTAPWPAGDFDGGGLSLQRESPALYGNNPFNWVASSPTAGAVNGAGVVAPPVVTMPPQNASVLEGAMPVFNVAASGAGPQTFQWRFKGLAIPGATNASFTIGYALPEDEGLYDVIVSNPGGATISAAANLQVQVPPVVLVAPTSLIARLGTNVSFGVVARGSAPLQYQWRLNGVNLPGANSAILLRNNVQLADDGVYDVVVSNPFASALASATLTVLSNTIIVVPPASFSVVTGAMVTVSLQANGNPLPFSNEWRRGSISLVTNVVNSRTDYFTFQALPFATSQIYRVIVRNLAQGANSANAAFTITTLADSDGDGIPDNFETAFGAGSNLDRDADADNDGASNWEEYIAGTNPTNELSYLRLDLSTMPGQATLQVTAVSNRTYTVQFSDDVAAGLWRGLGDIVSRTNNRVEMITDPGWTTNRFYRIATPRQP